MIAVEIFDPTGEDKLEDDKRLVVLLASLIKFRSISHLLELQSGLPEQKAKFQEDKANAHWLINQVYPLLGLTQEEVIDLILQSEE